MKKINNPQSVRTVVGVTGIAVALITVLSLPVGFAVLSYLYEARSLAFKASHNAHQLARFIYISGDLWSLQPSRIGDLVDLGDSGREQVRQRVYDSRGVLVLEQGDIAGPPFLTRTAPVHVAGEAVGEIEVASPLRPLIIETSIIGVIGFCLGALAYLVIRTLPLRMLDRTLGKLEATAAALRQTNEQLRHRTGELEASRKEVHDEFIRFDAAISNMSQGVCMFGPDLRVTVLNERFRELLSLTEADVQVGTTLRRIIEAGVRPGLWLADQVDEVYQKWVDAFVTRKGGSATQRYANGRVLKVDYVPLADGGWITTQEDITERVRSEARIAHLARHDVLTELPNRLMFRERLDSFLRAARDAGQRVAVLCLDLDRFKGVNDNFGHPAGDELLVAVAARLRDCVRAEDLIARLGGDEFAVVSLISSDEGDPAQLAARLVAKVGGEYRFDRFAASIGVSVGIAVAPDDGDSADVLLKKADMALYRAKADGRGTFHLFEPAMETERVARQARETDLQRAHAEGEFDLYFQPMVELPSGRICAAEALLRWRHPQRGLVSPGEFIPLAEETGLIVPLGEWVMRRACAEATRWPEDMRVAVNLSPVQLKGDTIIHAVRDSLASTGLKPDRLEVEITETALIDDEDIACLRRMRELGVRLSLDDFGTGYSSLSHLRRLPFDRLKIDRSFISDVTENADSAAIVRSLIALGQSLGMTTVAEGVETCEQRDWLIAAGCSHAQGYLFGMPQPVGQLAALFSEPQRKSA